MKVLYNNKVGSLIPLIGFNCADCIFCPSNLSISDCMNRGLIKLCVDKDSNCYKFITSQSDLLTYEN
jgi:hypothetical protein